MSSLLLVNGGGERWQPQTQRDILPRWRNGLAFALLPGLGWGTPEWAVTAPSLAGVYSDTRFGQAYKSSASATKSWNTACGSLGNEYTALVLANYTASQPFIADDSPTSNLLIQCGGATGKFLITAYNTSGTAYTATSGAVSTPEQTTGTVLGFRASSSRSKVQVTVDGLTTTTATTGTLRSPSNPRIGGLKAGTAPNAIIAFAAMWSYYMLDSELLELLSNPIGIFPITRQLYFPVATGGFTGTITTGSLVKTGQVPIDTIGFNFSPGVGNLVKTGHGTSLTRSFIFTPTAGSLVKTGQVATLTRRFSFTPGVGSLVKTGQIPTLTRKFTFTPGTGSIVKTGQQPTLYSPLAPTTGAIIKTGHIPVLTISSFGAALAPHSWFVKAIGVKTKGSVHSQVDSDSGDTP